MEHVTTVGLRTMIKTLRKALRMTAASGGGSEDARYLELIAEAKAELARRKGAVK